MKMLPKNVVNYQRRFDSSFFFFFFPFLILKNNANLFESDSKIFCRFFFFFFNYQIIINEYASFLVAELITATRRKRIPRNL